ncbi:MAG: S-layer homology domain-containing protein [Firmicutes bacterium]|nr:S-layer homology domain-containing protein [Bacillota bacterium]
MKREFKRIVSALLVAVMVLAMLPLGTMAAAEEYSATPISGIPEAGTPFVIYATSAGVVMGSETTNGKTTGYAAAPNEEDASLKITAGSGLFYLVNNDDGTYYLTCGGKYYTATSTSAAKFADAAGKGSKWKIETLGEGYRIANTDYLRNGQPACIEVYNSTFSPWGFDSANEGIFTMQFFAVDASADADGDGYIGTKPVTGEKPADGDKVVIYNAYGGACFGEQSDDKIAPSLLAVPSELTDSALEAGNGTLIFTVHFDGTYYTFENQGRYLRISPNETNASGKTTNAECLYFDTEESDYTKWTLEQCTGGYIIYNKTAKYGNNSVCIEYFSGAFSGWTYNGSTQLFAMQFHKVEDEYGLGFVLNPKMSINAENAVVGSDYVFTAALDELTQITDMTMTYTVDGGTEKAAAQSSVDGYTYTFTVPEADLAGKTSLTLKGTATNEYGMTYTAEKTVKIIDIPSITSVSPLPGASLGTERRPEIVAEFANCGTDPTVTMKVDGTAVIPVVSGNRITYTPAADMADGRHTVAVTVTRADGKQAEMNWFFFVGETNMRLYFGQIHSHTAEYSDGAGQLEDAYEYAMQQEDVDFLIVTDHSNYFDTTSTATTSSYYDLSSLTKRGSITKWEEARQTAAEYNAMRDDFVAAYGYEMTWSGGPGHTNTFNTYGPVSRNNAALNNKTGYAGMHLYNDLMVNANTGLDVDGNAVAEGVQTKYIEDAPVVSQLNHPGTTFGTFDNYAGYTIPRDTVINLIEVGNGEGAVGGSSYWPSYSEYDKCLAKGWHVAPTNNQDNHKGKWGNANTCRDVILTDDFTEAGLYRAMSERRVYATEDQNLCIFYYLNDEIMGTIIDSGDTEIAEVNIAASISDPDGEKLGKIEIIGENGITLKSFEAAGSTYELKTTIPNTDAYYYLKVTQADGDIAVTAPVWVSVATPIIASIETDTALSVVGQSENITVTVENAADADYTLRKVELTLVADGEETVVKTLTDTSVVKSGESKTLEIDYTRTVSGTQELKVVFYGTYQGEEFKCSASMTQKVYQADKLVKIGIDYGHGNFYVSGGYSDSMGNFIRYCADHGVLAEFIQKGEFTYANLAPYKMVILTVPFDSGTVAASAYTAEEIDALRKYAAGGGSLIITSKSDRRSPTDELNCAALTNTLLDAIDSNVRIANGIIVDNELKANEAYRVYFSGKENFNLTHPFTKGAYTASNAFGTTPSAENSAGFQLYNAAPVLINEGAEEQVTTLVRGYPTTWGASYTDNFDGSTYIPDYETDTVTAEMGNVNIMTYEELSGGGWLVVSGCTFFSNYDIKDDADYANKFIVQNILREVTGANAVEITPIATAKQQTVGSYTIEGYVTSNASGYDQNTAFFDCIYVQDKDGNGINVFPVAGNYAVGMHVQVHGDITFYCGEVELNLSPDYDGYIRVVSDEIYEAEPKEVDCATAMSDAVIGNLMKVKGVITELHKTEGVIDKIYVRDATGVACLFINGYIMKNYTGLDDLQVGMMVSGVGIGSRDVDESSETSAVFSRLRVRNRAEICRIDCEHLQTELRDAKDATCTEDGYTGDTYCVDCGELLSAGSVIAALGHDFGEWTQTKAPTCTETGEEKRTCSRCDAFETRELEAAGHSEVVDAAVPATCTENGKTEGKHCTVCGTVIVAQEAVTALGHSYKDGVCTVCGAKDPDNQPAAPVEFTDVSEKAWYYDAVEYAVENNLMNGVGGGNFDPEGSMTRAMLVTVLWRYEGEPAEGENTFTDVPNGTWYTGAVAWAAANGIVGGVGNGKFDPNGIITREQMATILFRYAQKRGLDTSKRGDLSVFPDSGKVSSWAKDAMRWAVAEKIINGSDGYLLPRGNATRAQVAALLMRFINKIETAAKPSDPPVDPKHVVTAGTRKLYIGMSLEELQEYAGAPEETLSTTAGYTWYVYGTKAYTDYAMAGVYKDKVVAICASGTGFSYRGCTANGSEAKKEADDTYSISMLKDKNDNGAIYGILLTDKKYRAQYATTKEALAGEARVAFHMANAFRVLHNVGILTWCDKAATAARLHCEDMAAQDYVAHTSADGRLFYMRLRENDVLYRDCAENLCAGNYNGIGAHNAWVNSADHRANLLRANMDHCGIGCADGTGSAYQYYVVADYYQAR